MNKKFQVFISSTYIDLKTERKKVAEAVNKSDHIAVGMELFPASNLSQWFMIKELIDSSDYYVLIIGARYGSISLNFEGEDKMDKEISWTQKEYEYAFKKNIPILTYFLSEDILVDEAKKDKTDKLKKKLESFKKILKNNGNYYEYWNNSDDLTTKVINALNQAYKKTPRPGWVRADELTGNVSDYNTDVNIKEKTIYYKFIHLSDQKDVKAPVYKKYITRTGETIDVYDEYITFRINHFSSLIKKFRTYDRTSGSAVEVHSLFPFIMNLRDADKKSELNPKVIQPLIYGPSELFITSSHYYNGFQENNKDVGIKVDKDTTITRIIVDFSSVPNFEQYISMEPVVFYSYHDDRKKGKLIHENIGKPKVLAYGIFIAEKTNMRDGEVLRIEFSTDFETMGNLS